MEMPQSCTKPLIYSMKLVQYYKYIDHLVSTVGTEGLVLFQLFITEVLS